MLFGSLLCLHIAPRLRRTFFKDHILRSVFRIIFVYIWSLKPEIRQERGMGADKSLRLKYAYHSHSRITSQIQLMKEVKSMGQITNSVSCLWETGYLTSWRMCHVYFTSILLGQIFTSVNEAPNWRIKNTEFRPPSHPYPPREQFK